MAKRSHAQLDLLKTIDKELFPDTEITDEELNRGIIGVTLYFDDLFILESQTLYKNLIMFRD